jgi:hypothetical protein
MARATVAVGVIVIVVVLVAGIYYYDVGGIQGFVSPTTGASPTSSSSIAVKLAQIQPVGQLQLNPRDFSFIASIQNNGQSQTRSIQVISSCSPDWAYCSDLGSVASTFVLPPGSSYQLNTTIACGLESYLPPCNGLPVSGQVYNFKVGVAFQDGTTQDLNVATIAAGKFAMLNPSSSISNPDTVAITVISSSIDILPNLSGSMAVQLSVDRSNPPTITVNLLNRTNFNVGLPTQNVLASATYQGSNCGLQGCPIIIGPLSLNLTASFSTVTTGISAGTYYMMEISVGSSFSWGDYVFWAQAQNAT